MAEAVAVGEPGLQAQAGVLPGHVARAFVVEAEVRHTEAALAFDQGVTELVEDHLRQAVVGVEGARGPNGHDALSIRRRIDLCRADYTKADAVGDGEPDRVEGVEVDVGRVSFHVRVKRENRGQRCLAFRCPTGDVARAGRGLATVTYPVLSSPA